MAGDWTKIRDDLKDDPAVHRIAKIVGLDRWSVVGRLSDIWSWVGRHTTNGEGVPLDSEMIDERVACSGFSAAMRVVRWLSGRDGALDFPKWDRHNSNSAKARALEAEAKRLRRSANESDNPSDTESDNCPTKSVLDVRPEKRREEYKTNAKALVAADAAGTSDDGSNSPQAEKIHRTPKLTTEEFLATLKANPAYRHINIDSELGKMDAWLSTQPGRQKTRRFVVNWLNKITEPLPNGAKSISTHRTGASANAGNLNEDSAGDY